MRSRGRRTEGRADFNEVDPGDKAMDNTQQRDQKTMGPLTLKLERGLKFLTPREITMIDDLLSSVAPFGEVRLAVQKGRLRFVSSVKSHDAIQLAGKGPGEGEGKEE